MGPSPITSMTLSSCTDLRLSRSSRGVCCFLSPFDIPIPHK
ncbi:superoxide dismutase, partial [Salmonella enterica subsp. enterica serovar Newport]|nr:superoxide dismutase [Salmonella enterica subsp. enterica serovar Newport]